MPLTLSDAFLKFFGCVDRNGDHLYQRSECGHLSSPPIDILFDDNLFKALDAITPETVNAFSRDDVEKFFREKGLDALQPFYPKYAFSQYPPNGTYQKSLRLIE